jgi:uncharacterized membrane protein YbjE (DUF340 family)
VWLIVQIDLRSLVDLIWMQNRFIFSKKNDKTQKSWTDTTKRLDSSFFFLFAVFFSLCAELLANQFCNQYKQRTNFEAVHSILIVEYQGSISFFGYGRR